MNRVAQRGSLRWYDPDRFDGFDLSRALRTAPLADVVMMVIFAVSGKGRFRRQIFLSNSGVRPDLGSTSHGTAAYPLGQSIELN